MRPEVIASVLAAGLALIVLVRLFLWKRGLVFSLFAAGVTFVLAFTPAYIILAALMGVK